MRRTLRIINNNQAVEDVPLFAWKYSREFPDNRAICVVVNSSGRLVALDSNYRIQGLIVDPSGDVWDELQRHPAVCQREFDRNFPEARVLGDAIWLDLDTVAPVSDKENAEPAKPD